MDGPYSGYRRLLMGLAHRRCCRLAAKSDAWNSTYLSNNDDYSAGSEEFGRTNDSDDFDSRHTRMGSRTFQRSMHLDVVLMSPSAPVFAGPRDGVTKPTSRADRCLPYMFRHVHVFLETRRYGRTRVVPPE